LDAAQPAPLPLPALRPILAPLHPTEVAALEERCGSIAKYWLPAKFEDSALSGMKTFGSDPGTLDIFTAALDAFVETEAQRDSVNAETQGCFRVDDPVPVRTWLAQHEQSLRSLSAPMCSNVARWLPLFQGTQGDSMLGDLSRAGADLVLIDASAR